jgi:hypothetical protein
MATKTTPTKKTTESVKQAPSVYVITAEELQSILTSIENNPLKYGIATYNTLEKVIGRGVVNGSTNDSENDKNE